MEVRYLQAELHMNCNQEHSVFKMQDFFDGLFYTGCLFFCYYSSVIFSHTFASSAGSSPIWWHAPAVLLPPTFPHKCCQPAGGYF